MTRTNGAEDRSDASRSLLSRSLLSVWAIPAILFLTAFAVRCVSWPYVLGPARTHFFGSDAYYHMRRIAYGLSHFPAVLDFDPYLNHPEGARAIWPPLFDWLLGVLLLPVYSVGGIEAAERAAAFVPPLLGAATVVATYVVGRRLFGATAALFAGLALCFLAGHYWYAQLGFVDHHAAVALAAVCLLSAATSCVATTRPTRRAGFALGALLAGCLLLWPGALIYVATVEVGLLVHWATRPDRSDTLAIARHRAWSHALAFALVVPFTWDQSWPQWGVYSPSVLSRFQPWLLGALALHAVLCVALLRRAPPHDGIGRRTGLIVSCGLAVLGVSALLLPGLDDALSEGWRWLGKRETFQGAVSESKPLFEVNGAFSTRVAEMRLSRFVYVLPIALVSISLHARRGAGRHAHWLFVGWGFALFAATLLQKRFFNTSSIAVALAFGWSFGLAWRWIRDRTNGSAPARAAGAVLLLALAFWCVLPSLETYRVPFGEGVARLRGRPLSLNTYELSRRSLLYAADWLRENTPETAGFVDAVDRPEYGVLAHWDLGHILLYRGQRATVVGNFGDDLGERNFMLHRRYFKSPEEGAVRVLDGLRARYVVVEAIPQENRGRLGPRTMLNRLTLPVLRDLAHHCLRYETPPPPSTGRFVPGYRIFERVAGAIVEGNAEAGAAVVAHMTITPAGGRERRLEHTATADPGGVYRLQLAQPGEAWTLESEGRTAHLAVSEDAVSDAGQVQGPDLRRARALP